MAITRLGDTMRKSIISLALLAALGCGHPSGAVFSERVSLGVDCVVGASAHEPLRLAVGSHRSALVRVPRSPSGPRAGQTAEFLSTLTMTGAPESQASVLSLHSVVLSGRAARIAVLPAAERAALRTEGLRLGAAGSALCAPSVATHRGLDATAAPSQDRQSAKEQRT